MTMRYVSAFARCDNPKQGHEASRFLREMAGLLLIALAGSGCSVGREIGADGGGAPGAPDAGGPGSNAAIPPVTWGLDAYRQWERMYRVRIGTRTYMRSTYDRAGGNEGVDASHFLRQEASYFVPLDVAGPGVVSFIPSR